MVYKMSVCIQHWRGIQPKLQQTYNKGQYIDAQEGFLKSNLLLAKKLGFIVIKITVLTILIKLGSEIA